MFWYIYNVHRCVLALPDSILHWENQCHYLIMSTSTHTWPYRPTWPIMVAHGHTEELYYLNYVCTNTLIIYLWDTQSIMYVALKIRFNVWVIWFNAQNMWKHNHFFSISGYFLGPLEPKCDPISYLHEKETISFVFRNFQFYTFYRRFSIFFLI